VLLRAINRRLAVLGAEIVPAWQRQWWRWATEFQLAGRTFGYFYHRYNCGWPPYASERCVELALADEWLAQVPRVDDVAEIGAVTPYYWPGRVKNLIDPYDPHPLVSQRVSLFDVDFAQKPVLSISTLEHIGLAEYGGQYIAEQAVEAVEKIFAESSCFLLTVPTGYNPSLDALFFDRPQCVPSDVHVLFLARGDDGCWSQMERSRARRPYDAPGVNHGRSAAGLIAIDRGNLLRLEL